MRRTTKYHYHIHTYMEMWVWLVAYLLGFALLQLYLYRYFIKGQSRESSPENATLQYEGAMAINQPDTDGDTDPSADFVDDAVVCSHCGGYNENDTVFSYCKHCGNRLR
jgi:hypothetical protein